MASRFETTDPAECWRLLAHVLRNEFAYAPGSEQRYVIEGTGEHADYIAHALTAERGGDIPEVTLSLRGREYGPICDAWWFTFTLAGLTRARHYWNDD